MLSPEVGSSVNGQLNGAANLEKTREKSVPAEEFSSWLPSVRGHWQRAIREAETTFSPFTSESQVFPSRNLICFDFSFGTHAERSRLIETPWNEVQKRTLFDYWDRIDTSFDPKTQQGELRWDTIRGELENIVVRPNFSDSYESKAEFFGRDLEDARKKLKAYFAAVDLGARAVIAELEERHDSFSRQQLYILQVANPYPPAVSAQV